MSTASWTLHWTIAGVCLWVRRKLCSSSSHVPHVAYRGGRASLVARSPAIVTTSPFLLFFLQTSRRALHLAPMAHAHLVPSRVPVAAAAVVLAAVAGLPPSRPRSQRHTPAKCSSVAFLQTSTKVNPRVIFTAAIGFQFSPRPCTSHLGNPKALLHI